MKLYVGNLSFNTSEQSLRDLFSAHGEVSSASLVMDRDTGRPRGFGFVEFSNDEQARAAIAALNGKNFDGRDLTVNEARPREGGGGGGGGGGGSGGNSSNDRIKKATQVSAVADARIQAVIVTAPKDLMEQIAGMMKDLDVASTRDQKVYVFQMKNGDPQQAAAVLQTMFQSSSSRSSSSSWQNSALQQRAQNNATTTTSSSSSSGFGGSTSGGGGARGGGGF